MLSLRKSIPPLPSLIAFEAAARLSSFTKAALELGVTQAAISRQIRELEQFLQVPLFERGYRSVELTPAGIALNAGLSVHLPAIASVAESVRAMPESKVVVVGMTSAFGTYWLAPRLPEFQREHPNVELRLAVNDEVVDLTKHRIDISIRYGNGGWPGLTADYLVGAEDMPVCHPSFWKGRERPTKAADLMRETLLCLEGAPVYFAHWTDWFAASGVPEAKLRHKITVNNFNLLIQAVLSGQGIGLAGYPLVDDLLASGMLVPAIDLPPMRIRGGYYVVKPERQAHNENRELFCRWLFDRARRDAIAGDTDRLLHAHPMPVLHA
jgi:LysR family glycine cleavage system transcriptional activator